jgi:hypothetical protein
MKTRDKLLWGFLWLTIMVYSAAFIYAAAPAHRSFYKAVTARTIDNQATGTTGWDSVDCLIAVASDTGAAAVVEVNGFCWLDPGEKLYVGFGNAAANLASGIASSNLAKDSLIYPGNAKGRVHIPFYMRHVYAWGAASTDTIFVNMATSGSGRNVEIQNCFLTTTIGLR